MKDFEPIYGTDACCNCLLPFLPSCQHNFQSQSSYFWRKQSLRLHCWIILCFLYLFQIHRIEQQCCAIRNRTHKNWKWKGKFSSFFFRFHFHSRGNFHFFFFFILVCCCSCSIIKAFMHFHVNVNSGVEHKNILRQEQLTAFN